MNPLPSHTYTPEIDNAITQSEIAVFLECQQKHQFRYVDKLELRDNFNIHLHFGSQFHNFLELLYSGKLAENEYVTFERPDVDKYYLTVEDDTKLALFEATFEFYQEQYRLYYKDDFLFNIEGPPEIEVVKVLNDNGDSFTGMIDVLWPNGSMIMDHKTKGQLADNVDDNMLQLNMYAMLSKFEETTVVVNQIKKFALRKTLKESDTMFAIRVRQDIKERPEAYFRRVTKIITKEDQERFKKHLLNPVVFSMANIRETERVRNYNACNNFGSQCEFYSLCFPNPEVTTPKFNIRKNRHNELAE